MTEPSPAPSITLQEFDAYKKAVEEATLMSLLFLEERTGVQVLGMNIELGEDVLCEFRFGGFLQEDESTDEPEPEDQ